MNIEDLDNDKYIKLIKKCKKILHDDNTVSIKLAIKDMVNELKSSHINNELKSKQIIPVFVNVGNNMSANMSANISGNISTNASSNNLSTHSKWQSNGLINLPYVNSLEEKINELIVTNTNLSEELNLIKQSYNNLLESIDKNTNMFNATMPSGKDIVAMNNLLS
jgi:hypothetical protein